jgi:hypothetical protein
MVKGHFLVVRFLLLMGFLVYVALGKYKTNILYTSLGLAFPLDLIFEVPFRLIMSPVNLNLHPSP